MKAGIHHHIFLKYLTFHGQLAHARAAQQNLERTIEVLVFNGIIHPDIVKGELRNIVGIMEFMNPIGLVSLALMTDGIYEPEQFPGLILRQDEPKVTYLIFHSGKVTIAGCKSIKDFKLAGEKIWKIIQAV